MTFPEYIAPPLLSESTILRWKGDCLTEDDIARAVADRPLMVETWIAGPQRWLEGDVLTCPGCLGPRPMFADDHTYRRGCVDIPF